MKKIILVLIFVLPLATLLTALIQGQKQNDAQALNRPKNSESPENKKRATLVLRSESDSTDTVVKSTNSLGPKTAMAFLEKMEKYEPKKTPTAREIQLLIRAIIKKAVEKKIAFKDLGDRVELIPLKNGDTELNIFRHRKKVRIVQCSFGEKMKIVDELGRSPFWKFGLTTTKVKGGEDKEEFIYPNFNVPSDPDKATLKEVNKKYFAFLKYYLEEMM
jgi:hypothetical protein